MKKELSLFLMCLSLSSIFATDLPAKKLEDFKSVFKSGEKDVTGYHTFRIPTIVKSKKGTLLSFAEGRVNGSGDAGNIDIVLRRSKDDGKTWENLQVIFDDKNNTCRNPSPVVDWKSGKIFLITTWSDKHESSIMNGHGKCKIFMFYSDDDGITWSKPEEITAQTNKDDWRWYATGPASATQIRKGKHKGRIIVPANHSVVENGKSIYRSHCFYSDNLGKTWKIGPIAGDGSNESQIAEISDGKIVQNMRQQQFGKGKRTQRVSADGGATWSEMEHVNDLYCSICQGSIIRDYFSNNLYFSNPSIYRRKGMTFYRSSDDGKTWLKGKIIWDGPAAYSNLVMLGKDKIGLLFECGDKDIAEGISFARYDVSEIFGPKKAEKKNK